MSKIKSPSYFPFNRCPRDTKFTKNTYAILVYEHAAILGSYQGAAIKMMISAV